jgi:ABC-type dipeptide/oligopeptide/nickel transport system ATPase subunit
MTSLEHMLSSAVEASLAPFLDEDMCEYIQSMLEDNPHDEDARESVAELLRGSIESDDTEDIITAFFERLDLAKEDHTPEGDHVPLRKLTQSVTMKEQDVQTFASGLSAGPDSHDPAQQSDIASFYANMIDISGNEAALSERVRRKARQKALREEMEEQERQRALKESMDVLNHDDEEETREELMEHSQDNSADVHLRHFDLPNLRGGGPDLLQNASLTLSKGRRYGLMGRNGCGKTTLMTFMANRQISGAIPKHMTMLLVRQEIMGNDWTAVETVLKSDVKRESVKRFIAWCEEEISRLEKGVINIEEAQAGGEDKKASSKSRQKLREKKKQNLQTAATAKATVSIKNDNKDIESKKIKLSEKLAKAYQRLAQIEEEEGSDPDPRARKVLSGLGFSQEMQNKPTRELSGGWRMRVSISCALFANPSLLLLDEPTNHLDCKCALDGSRNMYH